MTNKFKLLAGVSALCLLSAGVAFGQLQPNFTKLTNAADTDYFQDLQGGNSNSVNTYVSGAVLRSYIFGSGTLHTGTPVLTGCISAGGTIVGTDYANILTGGTTASTSCIETFSVAFASRPICSVTSQSAPATTTPSYTVATNAITITQASLSTAIYDVICVAQAGG